MRHMLLKYCLIHIPQMVYYFNILLSTVVWGFRHCQYLYVKQNLDKAKLWKPFASTKGAGIITKCSHIRPRCQSDNCRRGVSSLYSPSTLYWIRSLLVEANWKRSQTDEAVWMLSKDNGVPIQSHLHHVVSDVVCVISLAKSFIRHRGYIVVLHEETNRHTLKTKT